MEKFHVDFRDQHHQIRGVGSLRRQGSHTNMLCITQSMEFQGRRYKQIHFQW